MTSPPTDTQTEEYVAIIDQDEVTDEVRNIAVKYDPLNRSGHEGFHVTDEGELHIDDSKVMRETWARESTTIGTRRDERVSLVARDNVPSR
jgi:hypothetical protein